MWGRAWMPVGLGQGSNDWSWDIAQAFITFIVFIIVMDGFERFVSGDIVSGNDTIAKDGRPQGRTWW